MSLANILRLHRWITAPGITSENFMSLHRKTWGNWRTGKDGGSKIFTNFVLAAWLGPNERPKDGQRLAKPAERTSP